MDNTIITFPMLGEGFSISPETSFELFGTGFSLTWYAVIITAGLLLAALYLIWRSRDFGIVPDNIYDMLICAVPSGIVGARLYYVLFNFSDYFGPDKLDSVFNIRGGGLAIYGGIIGGIIAIAVYSAVKKIRLAALLDVASLGVIIGQTAGRWGNFINREAYGGVTDLPWKMGLTRGSGTVYVHPTFLYESLWNLIGFIFLHFYSKKRRRYDGEIFLMYAAWYGLGRFFIEGLRTDSLMIGDSGIRVSQVVAACSFVLGVLVLIRNRITIKSFPVQSVAADEPQSECENAETDGV